MKYHPRGGRGSVTSVRYLYDIGTASYDKYIGSYPGKIVVPVNRTNVGGGFAPNALAFHFIHCSTTLGEEGVVTRIHGFNCYVAIRSSIRATGW